MRDILTETKTLVDTPASSSSSTGQQAAKTSKGSLRTHRQGKNVLRRQAKSSAGQDSSGKPSEDAMSEQGLDGVAPSKPAKEVASYFGSEDNESEEPGELFTQSNTFERLRSLRGALARSDSNTTLGTTVHLLTSSPLLHDAHTG